MDRAVVAPLETDTQKATTATIVTTITPEIASKDVIAIAEVTAMTATSSEAAQLQQQQKQTQSQQQHQQQEEEYESQMVDENAQESITSESIPIATQIPVVCDNQPMPSFDWTNKWLKGDEYAFMLRNIDAYCLRYGFNKYDRKTHPENIYKAPQNGLIYFVEGGCVGSEFGFPRVPFRKQYRWKKMNFTTDLPKKRPKVTYIVASSVKCSKPQAEHKNAQKSMPPVEQGVFRMHAVILYKDPSDNTNQQSQQGSSSSSNNNNNHDDGIPVTAGARSFILCHIRRIDISEAISENPVGLAHAESQFHAVAKSSSSSESTDRKQKEKFQIININKLSSQQRKKFKVSSSYDEQDNYEQSIAINTKYGKKNTSSRDQNDDGGGGGDEIDEEEQGVLEEEDDNDEDEYDNDHYGQKSGDLNDGSVQKNKDPIIVRQTKQSTNKRGDDFKQTKELSSYDFSIGKDAFQIVNTKPLQPTPLAATSKMPVQQISQKTPLNEQNITSAANTYQSSSTTVHDVNKKLQTTKFSQQLSLQQKYQQQQQQVIPNYTQNSNTGSVSMSFSSHTSPSLHQQLQQPQFLPPFNTISQAPVAQNSVLQHISQLTPAMRMQLLILLQQQQQQQEQLFLNSQIQQLFLPLLQQQHQQQQNQQSAFENPIAGAFSLLQQQQQQQQYQLSMLSNQPRLVDLLRSTSESNNPGFSEVLQQTLQTSGPGTDIDYHALYNMRHFTNTLGVAQNKSNSSSSNNNNTDSRNQQQ